MKKAIYVFACPVCRKQFVHDEPGEPCCTGPSETSDDHEMQVMKLVRVDRREVGPKYAQARADGQLLIPGGVGCDDKIQREILIARK